jgi:hypothetical protein
MEYNVLRLSMHKATLIHDRNWAPFQQLVCSKWASNYRVFCSHKLVPSMPDAHLLTSPLSVLPVIELLQLRDLLEHSEEAVEGVVRTNPPPGFVLWCSRHDC